MNDTTSLIKSYKGKTIRVNPIDRYTCLTDMATASGKKLAHWHQLEGTKAYLEALSEATAIAIGTLLHVENGVTTWAHPKVAIKFAAWCSPQFEIQVTTWIDELMTTGKVELVPSVQLPQDFATALRLYADEVEAKQIVEQKLALAKAEVAILEQETVRQAEVIDELFDYSSIVRVAIYNKITEKSFNWRQLKAASIVKGVEIKQAPCPRFVTKNLYHHDVWRLAYPGIALPETTTLVLAN